MTRTAAFSSRWLEAAPHVTERAGGGLAGGFRAAGVAAGIKPSGDPDLGLLVCDEPDVTSAARFTRSGAIARRAHASPSRSSRPNIALRFWTACDAAPFQRLSIAAKTRIRPVRGSEWTESRQ